MWAGRQGASPGHPGAARELARRPVVPWWSENCGHQRGALGVVPQLPKRCWVVRAGRSRNRADSDRGAQAGLSHYFPAGSPATNYPYTTQMSFPGSALGSGIQKNPAAVGFLGERGGTRTHDPMIKSHGLNANPKFAVRGPLHGSIVGPASGCCWRRADSLIQSLTRGSRSTFAPCDIPSDCQIAGAPVCPPNNPPPAGGDRDSNVRLVASPVPRSRCR